MLPSARSALFACGLSLLPTAVIGAQQFPAGSVYMMSAILDLPPNQIYAGIRRVEPATGNTYPFVTFPGNAGLHVGGATYDPFRDRILVSGPISPAGTYGTHSIDATGNWTQLTPQLLLRLAPRGDGKVYGYRQAFTPAFLPRIHYLDAANVEHTLLDVGGVNPWAISGNIQVFGDPIKAMIYEPGENALFVAFVGDSAAPSCVGTASYQISVRKLPLTNNGTALRSAPSCATFNVTSQSGSIETPLNFSYGPGSTLVLSVCPDSSGAASRFLRIDPVTVAITTFATVGPYFGDWGFSGGVYCPTTGRALMLGGDDKFRSYGLGESGGGTLLASYGPAGLGNAPDTFFVVGPVGPGASLRADTLAVSASAGGTQNLTFAPGPGHAGELYLIAGSLSGWLPGLPLAGGLTLPLNFDAYTSLTITLANSPFLVNTSGTLGLSGVISAQVVLPPGVLVGLQGLTLHHAAVAADLSINFTHVSNPVPMQLLP